MIIQDLIDAASPGDTVTVPAGVYDIDTIAAPIWIKKSLTLNLSVAAINVLPTSVNDSFYFPIGITDCDNVTVVGGKIIGDRHTHLGPVPDGAGKGFGIVVGPSSYVTLQGITISNCLMDGVLVNGGKKVQLDHVVSISNRRQGFTASNVDTLWIHDCEFSVNGGTAPGAGIDLEPDTADQSVRIIKIERSYFAHNAGAGVLVNCPPAQRSSITITSDNIFIGKPIDGTDGIVSWWAKLIGPWTNWFGYPRKLVIP